MKHTGSCRIDDVRDIDLEPFSDGELETLSVLVGAERQRRALASGNLDALTEAGFLQGFGQAPVVKDPWVNGGVLVASGGRFDRGGRAHRCSFVKIGGTWVWEHPGVLSDEIRRAQNPQAMRSVTLVALNEGERVDLVSSRSRDGVHTMNAVRSFVYHDGVLELVNARTIDNLNHR